MDKITVTVQYQFDNSFIVKLANTGQGLDIYHVFIKSYNNILREIGIAKKYSVLLYDLYRNFELYLLV